MTEFEQQVADALSAAWAREDGPPFAMDGVWQWLAPRVAAAIEAAAYRVNGPPGDPELGYDRKLKAALAVLRGER